MAKSKNNTTENTTENTAQDAVSAASPASADASAPETATAAPSELAVVEADLMESDNSMQHLIPKLPHLRSLLQRTHRVEPAELDEGVSHLSDESQRNFSGMLERMNPEKPGMHLSATSFQVPDIRMYHGTGNDENRPPTAPEGSIYTSDSRVLFVPETHRNFFPGIPSKVNVAVVGVYEVRTYWPPRAENGKDVVLPPGVTANGNAPICRSLDRKKGDRFGDCSACPYRPWKDGKFDRSACRDEMHLYVVLQGFSGIYRMVITGTSVKSAGLPIKKKALTWGTPWDFYFSLSTSKQTNGGSQRWFQYEAVLATDPANPNGLQPTADEKRVLALLSRQIETEAYLPGLASIYNRAASAPVGEVAADLKSMISDVGGASGSATPDFSKNNNV